MRGYCFIIIFLATFNALGQDKNELDSLKIKINKTVNDSLKQNLLKTVFNKYLFIDLDSAKVYHDKIIQIPKNDKKALIEDLTLSSKYHYYSSNLDSALYFTNKALKLSLKIDDLKLSADLYRKMAILSSRDLDYVNAEKYGKLALAKAYLTKDWKLIASSNFMLGNQYYKKNNFDVALKLYIKVDSLYTTNNSTDRFLASCYDNIASIYTDIKDEKALEYIEKGKKIYEGLNDLEGLHYNYTLKGMYYQRIEETEVAIMNYEKALAFYKAYGNVFREIDASSRLIVCYSIVGYFDKGEKLLKEIEQKEEVDALNSESFNFYYSGGELYLHQKKYNASIKYFNKANSFNYSKIEYSIRQRQAIYQGLTHAYLGKNDYENAFNSLNEFKNITDSIYLKNNAKQVLQLETKYQTEKKEKEIALLKSEKELTRQKQKSQRNLLIGGLGFTTLAGLFLFVMFRNRQKTNIKLKELDTAKSNFFANISHEFRTPLTLMANPIDETLEDQTLSDKKREQFAMAKRNSDRLLSLVNQLLDLSKIDAGQLKLRIQKGNIQHLIAALAESFNYSAKENKIKYNLDIKAHNKAVWFDKDALEKITVNLLSNAIKYTPKEGLVSFKSFIKNNKLYLNIKNSGVRLTKDELSHLFTRFYQTDKQNQGTGIGLALVKELVELHKGSINVISESNNWVEFSVMLPIDKKSFKNEVFVNASKTKEPIIQQSTNLPETIENELDDNDKPILLIVEDNADVRRLLKQTFKDNYNIITAKNGQIGIDLAIKHVPDIVISDIMMPIQDGVALTKYLKNNELTSHIPIVLLTAKAGDKNELKGIETGADDYITKPFSTKLLKTKISNLIEIRRKLQSRYSQEIILTPKDIAVTNLDERFLKKVQQIFEDNLIEPSFSVEGFSKAAGMSRMQLHRKIKALTGLSASGFVRSQRLKLAAELLKTSDINISQVGYSVGFNDHSYFTKCFKKAYHCTPTEFADKHSGK